MRVCCFDACCPANLGAVRFLFGLVRFGLWFVSGFLAVLKTGSVNRFPVRFSTFLFSGSPGLKSPGCGVSPAPGEPSGDAPTGQAPAHEAGRRL